MKADGDPDRYRCRATAKNEREEKNGVPTKKKG